MSDWLQGPVAIREDEPLASKTTWGIGGVAQYFAEPRDETEVMTVLREAERQDLRVFMLGGGSNLLITDGVLQGLVLRLAPAGPLSRVQHVDTDTCQLRVGAAMPLTGLLQEAAAHGFAGLADMAGIPGTVGGAVRMNAGNPARGLGAFVESVEGVDLSGRRVLLEREQIHFAYRWSNLKDLMITAVSLRLRPGNEEEIREEMQALLKVKRQHQPLAAQSAGCVFKNPRSRPAGMLIEGLGLKGFHVGDAEVSQLHANFIINKGAATCDQTRRVIDHVRREVLRAHRIELRLEITLWL